VAVAGHPLYASAVGWGMAHGRHDAAARGGEGRGANAAVRRRGVIGSSPTAMLVGGAHARGA
jgi:hypothetical protein